MTSSHAVATPMPTKINKCLHQNVLLTSKWSSDYYLWNDKCMQISKNGQNQISWGDYSHISDHKINSDICLQ